MTATRDISLDRLTFAYPGVSQPVLQDIDWDVSEGEFVVVAGASGSGKSTLLRCLNGLVPHFTGGRFGGRALVRGYDTRHHGPRVLSRSVGFVFQEPDAQSVATRVEDELAFGMEQLGLPQSTMRKRVEEALDLLGIAELRDRDLSTLSGGERQRVAVAAALTLQPRVLVLDEPTSQLDPWGADDVITALDRLNEDLGLTIVLAEHRLERVLGQADRLRLIGEHGTIDGTPREVMASADPSTTPPLIRLSRALGWERMPLTVKDARQESARDGRTPADPAPDLEPPSGPSVISARKLTATFGKRVVLEGVDFEVRPGELVALMGRNGSGKTTLLRSLLGFHRPSAGSVHIDGREVGGLHPSEIARSVGYLPQRPGSLLFSRSVREELAFTLRAHGASTASSDATLQELGLLGIADRYPRDLSVGEQERTALAAVLVGSPRVLLLDEPTRGMDAARKRSLAATLTRLRLSGVAIVMATHDVELVAECATRIVLLGDAQIIADGPRRAMLSGSLTLSTQINKLYGGPFLTVEDVLAGLPTT